MNNEMTTVGDAMPPSPSPALLKANTIPPKPSVDKRSEKISILGLVTFVTLEEQTGHRH